MEVLNRYKIAQQATAGTRPSRSGLSLQNTEWILSLAPSAPHSQSKPHYCVLKYITEPVLGCPYFHMLPPSLIYSGWCRLLFLLSVPARLYSPSEALCLTVQLIPVALKLRKVCSIPTQSCFLIDQLQVYGQAASATHVEGLLWWNPARLHYKLQNWSLRSQPLKRNTLNHHLTFNIN